jgi:hypothetical protein
MQDDLFFNTTVTPIDILDRLYQESSVDSNYYPSPAKPPVMRCDVSEEVRQYFKKLLAVPFRDCGFLKTPPSSVYPTHRDSFRTTALNMLMVDNNKDFETFMFEDNATRHAVPYAKNEFMILNVMSLHGVINRSKDLHRIVFSIGIPDYDYATILNLHRENKLFKTL